MRTIVKTSSWLVVAALLTILSIFLHEVFHYAAAVLSGAENVKLHWADITFDSGSLGSRGLAVTWLAGPILTHTIILWVLLSKTNNLAALALGLGACSRNLVLLPFTIKFLLGRDTSTFTNDEVTVGQALEVSPMIFALPAVALSALGLYRFLTRAKRASSIILATVLVLGVVLGIASWGIIGPILLPGGKGFS